MKRTIILKIEYITESKILVIYQSGVYSTIIPMTVKQLKKQLGKNPNQICLEDISKLKKVFVFEEKMEYIDKIETWTSIFGYNLKRTNEIFTAQFGDDVIEIKESNIPKDKFRFSHIEFDKAKNRNKSKKDGLLLLLKGREKSKISEDGL